MSVDDIVKDITSNMANDGSADYIQLIEKLGMVGTITNVVLGLLVTIIVIGVPLVVAIELCYINFPVLQTTFEKAVIKTTGNLNKALGLVIHDARIAVQAANTVETGRDANWIYLKIKCKAIFLAVICAGLVLGAGPSVINIIVTIAKSLIDGFNRAI